MDSKKKIVLRLTILAFVILAIIPAVVAVFAATQQTINTGVNVTYIAIDVDGSVEATYTIGTETTYLQRSDGSGTKITFEAGEESNDVSLIFPENLQLTSTNRSIVIRYMFTNTGGNVYTAILGLSGLDVKNMKLEYSLDGNIYVENQYALVVKNTEISNMYIRITVEDVSKNANFSGMINWTLENYNPIGNESEIPVTNCSYNLLEDGTYSACGNMASTLVGNTLVVPSSVGAIRVSKYIMSSEPENSNLVITEGITTLDASMSTMAKSISIPASVTNIIGSDNYGATTFFYNSMNLEEIKVAEGNTVYHSEGNCLIHTATGGLLAGAKNCEIPRDGSVTAIACAAFYARGQQYFYIPASVTMIVADNGPPIFPILEDSSKVKIFFESTEKPTGLGSLELWTGREYFKGWTYEEYLICKNNPDYDFNKSSEENLVVTKYTGNETEITIPYGVVEIGAGFLFENTTITEVVIPETVTIINKKAFHTSALEMIFIPKTVETMPSGDATFTNMMIFCEAESKPSGWKCNTNSCQFLYGYTYKEYLIEKENIKYLAEKNPDYVFSGSIINAYNGTASVLEIPMGVTSIANGVFRGNTNLVSVTIPQTMTKIGDNVFFDCSNLKSINIPQYVTSIGGSTFRGCSSLERIEVSPDNESFASEGNCLLNKAKTKVIAGCKTSVIPETVTSIGANAFYASGIRSIEIPSSVTSIGANAFTDCTGLTSITIPNKITTINASTFQGCTNLLSFTIPETVTSIKNNVFYNCSSLTAISIPSSVTSIGSKVFSGCTALAKIEVDSSNTKYASEGNCLLNKAKTELIAGCKTSVIPTTVQTIKSNAFYNCTSLTSITFSAGVTTLENNAFYGCTGLTSLTITSGITTICAYTFSGCTNLRNVTFAVTTNWYTASSKTAEDGTNLNSATLANATTAATELTSTSVTLYWKRRA